VDTDGDGLTDVDPWSPSGDDCASDYFELLVGYRVLLDGEPTFREVFTNDTDGDGRSDGVEIDPPLPCDVETDPLVPDVCITVSYREVGWDLFSMGGRGKGLLVLHLDVAGWDDRAP